MLFDVLKSKIHRATVTQSHLNYVGSLTVDQDLMGAAGLRRHEKVDLVGLNNGARLSTYAIEGPRGSGVIGVNGSSDDAPEASEGSGLVNGNTVDAR